MSFRISNTLNKNITNYRNINITPKIDTATEISKNVTIVTAYYTINSKFSNETYMTWINNFMTIKSNMIIFTDSINYEKFKNFNKENCKIVLLEMKDFYTSKWDEYWKFCKNIDAERHHTPELYKIWAEKAYLLKLGSELDPFNSDYFFWVDIGCVRYGLLTNYINYFPNYNKMKNYDLDKFFLSSVENFNGNDSNLIDGISPIFRNISTNTGPSDIFRIQGGFFGGNKESIKKWSDLYYSELDFFESKKQYGGKDQYIMGNIYLKNKDLFNLLEPQNIYVSPYLQVNKWFSFLIRFC